VFNVTIGWSMRNVRAGKSFKLTTLIDFQIDSNMLYNLKIDTFLAYGEAFSN
jgi:hypothetical protein